MYSRVVFSLYLFTQSIRFAWTRIEAYSEFEYDTFQATNERWNEKIPHMILWPRAECYSALFENTTFTLSLNKMFSNFRRPIYSWYSFFSFESMCIAAIHMQSILVSLTCNFLHNFRCDFPCGILWISFHFSCFCCCCCRRMQWTLRNSQLNEQLLTK